MKAVEDALFRANDSYDEIDSQNRKLKNELDVACDNLERERMLWEVDRGKLEQNLR